MAPPPTSPIARTRGRSRRSAPGIPPRSRLPEAAIRNVFRHCWSALPRCRCCACSPSLGRVFSAEDDTPGNPLRVVLTYGYWQRRFGGAENVVGQSLVIDGRPAEVIGVLPSSFKFLRTRPDIVLPMPLDVNAPARNQLRVSGARAAEAGRHAGPGQRRCGAHDLASPAGLCEIGVAAERAPAGR